MEEGKGFVEGFELGMDACQRAGDVDWVLNVGDIHMKLQFKRHGRPRVKVIFGL
jgi:hypothetical protein